MASLMLAGARAGAPLIAAATLAACSLLVSHVDPADEPLADKAYVYARIESFKTSTLSRKEEHSSHVAITLTCDDGDVHMLTACEEQPIRLKAVTPGTCALGTILVKDALGVPQEYISIPNFAKKVRLRPGRAYYLRDIRVVTRLPFVPVADIFPGGSNTISSDSYRSQRTIYHRYEQSTKEFVKAFPNFASMPTEDSF